MPSLLCKPFQCFSKKKNKREAERDTANGGGTARTVASTARTTTKRNRDTHVHFDMGGSGVFHDAQEGVDSDWEGRPVDSADDASADGMIYLDCVDDFSNVAAYPPVITSAVPPHPSDLDLNNPETLLRSKEMEDAYDEAASERTAKLMENQSRKMLSASRVQGMRKSTRALRKELTKPGVIVEEKGFPGELTNDEVEAVQIFRRELEKRDPVYSEIVHGFEAVEEEAYALCRYLRARKFNPEQVFQLLDEGKDLWKWAKQKDFFPDVEQAVGAPRSVFTSQYPFVYSGRAKNGCPVAYLHCGNLQSEGVLCITTMERIPGYFWNSFMYDFIDQLKMCKEANKNFVRCECMQVYDLKGLARAQINSEAIEVIKMANQITTCFPETLHGLVIVNAPGFFSFAWNLIKKFIDPRTAAKIEVYSSEKAATRRLLELIDSSQLSVDYGGTAPSLAGEIQKQSLNTPDARGNVVELMNVKNKETKFEFDVPANEAMTISIYTRLRSGAHFAVYNGPTLMGETDVKHEGGEGGDKKDQYVDPYCTEIMSNVKGPGKFHIVGKALSKSQTGFFLFVGEKTAAR